MPENKVVILSPRSKTFLDARNGERREWPGTLRGLRVALVDNGRPNAYELLQELAQRLTDRFNVTVEWVRKAEHFSSGGGGTVAAGVLEFTPDLAQHIDVMMTGVATMGPCTLRGVLDAAELATRGVRSLVFATTSRHAEAVSIAETVHLPASWIIEVPDDLTFSSPMLDALVASIGASLNIEPEAEA